MRILFDTNVVLDVLLDRPPHAEVASRLLSEVDRKRIEGLLCATTVTTVSYLAGRVLGAPAARKALHTLLGMFETAPVDHRVLSDALLLGFADYEDAVLHEAARHAGAAGIVTRDAGGFAKARLRIYAPGELLKIVAALPAP